MIDVLASLLFRWVLAPFGLLVLTGMLPYTLFACGVSFAFGLLVGWWI